MIKKQIEEKITELDFNCLIGSNVSGNLIRFKQKIEVLLDYSVYTGFKIVDETFYAGTVLVLYGTRSETNTEYQKRTKKQKKLSMTSKEREYKKYLKLKEKFETKNSSLDSFAAFAFRTKCHLN